jgi:hypothetical protein
MSGEAKNPDDETKPVEPCVAPSPLTTPAQLGSHYAGRARAAGCEDEYDNAMEARYGKGW